jgi:hypothetical protein
MVPHLGKRTHADEGGFREMFKVGSEYAKCMQPHPVI